jgi:thioredoxin reductase
MQSCAVIGCGPAGMAASTALRQSGLLVTCFDIAPGPGGIWSSNARDVFSSRGAVSPVYPTMRCVLPKELMCFSDVRFDYTVPQFPHHTAVQHYMLQYASQKGVRGLTRFNTKVESARFDPTDRLWKLISVNVLNGDVMEWAFDRVCVCTGQTQEVRFPVGLRGMLEGYVREGGELHHSAHVKDFRSFRNKRVVVIGDGVSAYDYCMELKRMGAEVTHSTTMQEDAAERRLAEAADTADLRSARRGQRRETASLASSVWRDAAGSAGGEADMEVSDLRVAADATTHAASFAARLPWLRNDVHAANDVVRKWLRYRNTRMESIPTVGMPVESEGRGVRFRNDPSRRLSTEELVAEAKERVRHGSGALASPAGVFIDNVDAIICATGYTRRYPFLHPDIRRVLEAEEQPLLAAPTSATATCPDNEAALRSSGAVSRRGLYLGTLWTAEPTLAVVGHQKELLPPFLMFEAQSRFVAYAFTQRLSLPDNAAALYTRETELLRQNPLLKDLYSADGVGLHSAVYFNVLQQELGVSSRDTYTAKIMRRQRWLLSSTLVRIYHKLRSMAPLKRKQQHLLFSNKV